MRQQLAAMGCVALHHVNKPEHNTGKPANFLGSSESLECVQ